MIGQHGEWPLSRILVALVAAVFLLANSRLRSAPHVPADGPRARIARRRLFWLGGAVCAAIASRAFPREPVATWTLFGLTAVALLAALKASLDLRRLPPHGTDAGQGGATP